MGIKILHVETGRHLYGGALQVYYLLRGLKENGCHNILVCPQGSAIASAAREAADPVYALPMGGDLDVRFVKRLWDILRAERPNLIHLHSRRGADVLGGIAGRLSRAPVVLTRRVDNPEPAWWARRKYRLYHRVIAISEEIRKVLIAEGIPEAKVVKVYSGVDTERFRPGCDGGRLPSSFDLDAFHLDAGHRVVGMVAQFIPRKGHRYLLGAVPRILDRFPAVRFLLFGRGPLSQEVQGQIVQAGLQPFVRLAGFREDLERLLPCLDVLVHPAEMEGLGVTLLQAAASGVPIVASAAGGMPEVVKDGFNGYLVPPGDVDAIARTVLRLLRAPEQAKTLGRQGRTLVEAEFSVSAMVQGSLQVYRGLLEEDNGWAGSG